MNNVKEPDNSKTSRKSIKVRNKARPKKSGSDTFVETLNNKKSFIYKARKLLFNSIAKKIALIFSISIIIFGFLIVFILLKSIHFNNEYNNLVDNIFHINEIRVNIISQPNKILNSCLVGDDLKTGSHMESAKGILTFLDGGPRIGPVIKLVYHLCLKFWRQVETRVFHAERLKNIFVKVFP
jgi:tetrahydromethanopterin S-methyltransferase subunit F